MTMKATQAMKMNITFWNSPMPNRAKVKGMTAATGMLRPMITSGPKKALIRRKQPQTMPSGTPTPTAKANPSTTRLRLTSRLRVNSRSNHKRGKAWNVAVGPGSVSGPMMGGWFSSPAVSHHHSARQTTMQRTPMTMPSQAGISARRTEKWRRRRGAGGATGVLAARGRGVGFDSPCAGSAIGAVPILGAESWNAAQVCAAACDRLEVQQRVPP